MTDLEGQVAIVTGAGTGIGAACARILAREGAKVMVHYRSSAQGAARVVAEIEAAGGTASAVQADLIDSAGPDKIARHGADTYGKIDILVNNSGLMSWATVEEIDERLLAEQFAVNAYAPIRLVRAVLPYFSPQGGAIVNVTTNLVHSALPGAIAYSAGKAALQNMTEGLFKELAPRGIRVNAVAPGATRTPMTAGQDQAAVAQRTPLGRIGEPEDIAEVVAFLASSRARWITGESILVDGGLTKGAFG